MKKVVIVSAIGAISTILSFILGYNISKRKYSPKTINGEIYIDHTSDPDKPDIFLNALNSKIFDNASNFIILRVEHVRK